jgi:UPF0716 protein FxsA
VIFLALLFILLPIAELYVIIQVGDLIGIWPTLGLLLIDGLLGAWLLRSQGRSAWRRFQEALARTRMPVKEVYDGAAIIFGAALLMTPGFITDVFGFLLLIPPTRAALRQLLVAVARRVGPARTVFFLYDRRPSGWRREGAGPRPDGGEATRGAPSRGYDYEGSAREIPVDGPELDRGEDGRR